MFCIITYSDEKTDYARFYLNQKKGIILAITLKEAGFKNINIFSLTHAHNCWFGKINK